MIPLQNGLEFHNRKNGLCETKAHLLYFHRLTVYLEIYYETEIVAIYVPSCLTDIGWKLVLCGVVVVFLTAFITVVGGSIKFYTLGCLVLVGYYAVPRCWFFFSKHIMVVKVGPRRES